MRSKAKFLIFYAVLVYILFFHVCFVFRIPSLRLVMLVFFRPVRVLVAGFLGLGQLGQDILSTIASKNNNFRHKKKPTYTGVKIRCKLFLVLINLKAFLKCISLPHARISYTSKQHHLHYWNRVQKAHSANSCSM